MEDEEVIELPEEYEIPEPEGFKNFTTEQKKAIVEKKKELDRAMADAVKGKKPKTEQEKQESHIMGKYMLKDMPLFKYEIILYMGMIMVGVMMYVIERAGLVEGAMGKMAIPAIILPLGIWFIKWVLYMPNKKRVPGMRIFRSGLIELRVEDISKGYIEYKYGSEKRKKFITKINKHTEASTGKPFVITSELEGENLNLADKDKPDMRSEEFNAILENEKAVVKQQTMNEMLKVQKPTLQNPLFLLLVINLAMVAVLLIKNFGIFEMIKGG